MALRILFTSVLIFIPTNKIRESLSPPPHPTPADPATAILENTVLENIFPLTPLVAKQIKCDCCFDLHFFKEHSGSFIYAYWAYYYFVKNGALYHTHCIAVGASSTEMNRQDTRLQVPSSMCL